MMQKIKFFLLGSLFLLTFGVLAADESGKDENKKEKPMQVSAAETMVRTWCETAVNDFPSCRDEALGIDCAKDEYKMLNNKLQQCLGAMIQEEKPSM